MEFEKQIFKRCKKLCIILHQRLLQSIFAYTDVANVVCTMSYTMLTVTRCCSESVVCGQDLTLKPLVVLLYITACPIICFKGTST